MSDTLVLGRVNYEEWAAHWPYVPKNDESRPMADYINGVEKYVVSTPLTSVYWVPPTAS